MCFKLKLERRWIRKTNLRRDCWIGLTAQCSVAHIDGWIAGPMGFFRSYVFQEARYAGCMELQAARLVVDARGWGSDGEATRSMLSH